MKRGRRFVDAQVTVRPRPLDEGHSAQDRPESLDYVRLAAVVEGVDAAIRELTGP